MKIYLCHRSKNTHQFWQNLYNNQIVYLGKLAILPAPDSEQIPHHIALLLAVQLGHVLVRTHPASVDVSEIIQIYVNNIEQHLSYS